MESINTFACMCACVSACGWPCGRACVCSHVSGLGRLGIWICGHVGVRAAVGRAKALVFCEAPPCRLRPQWHGVDGVAGGGWSVRVAGHEQAPASTNRQWLRVCVNALMRSCDRLAECVWGVHVGA